VRLRPAAALVCGGCTALVIVTMSACADPSHERLRKTTKGTYDKTTGKLTEITYDRNQNGVIDTWTEMDGARPLRSRIDLDEDGKIDRWEYYDGAGALVKVGFSRTNSGKPDAWAFSRADGSLERVEVSSTADEHAIDRREYYDGGVMVRVEEDTDRDGRIDLWEIYENGSLKTAEFDENHDGHPDRRLTYLGGELVLIESQPDETGHYMKRDAVLQQ
jgi:hypothetical protein